MKKQLMLVALALGTAVSLAADPTDAQFLLHVDGLAGVRTSPAGESGHLLGGPEGGFEYMASPMLGMDIDYNYLIVGKPVQNRDNDFDLSLRAFGPNWYGTSLWLQGGIGLNSSPNVETGRYLAFVEPGFRVNLAPWLAFDAGAQFLVTTPRTNFVQAVAVTAGFSIPLGGSLTTDDSESGQAAPMARPTPESVTTPLPTPIAAAPAATPAATPAPAVVVVVVEHHHHHAKHGGELESYVVKDSDCLWRIAARHKIFGDGRLWPLLLLTNQGLSSDPNVVVPGTTLTYRSFYTDAEKKAARDKEAKFGS